ncbi:MAG: riboflavin biosynthesis protein RibF [Candidatus Omnitrophica bacterium]|nr:riboflavin biosynthesis protein RibF [Candidatus Omnitrophota bacterium]
MKVVHGLEEYRRRCTPQPTVVAIGTFDGVHRGHQTIIRRAVREAGRLRARSLILTFFPHPLNVTSPDRQPALLTALAHRLRLIGCGHPDICVVVGFAREFARMSPEEFCRDILCGLFQAKAVVVGDRFRFGYKRCGTVVSLRRWADGHQVQVIALAPQMYAGEAISSTRIRAAVERGDLSAAEQMLGRPFTILGTVVHGDKRGRTLRYPTMNIDAHQEAMPPKGVYAVRVKAGGRWRRGMLNIGTRPTFEPRAKKVTLETHVFDFHRSWYGRSVEIEFICFLRPEKKYASRAALIRRMQWDELQARRILAVPGGWRRKSEEHA